MKILKNWWNKRKKKEQDRIAREIRSEFEVVEKCGILYLTHNGVAFERMTSDITASDVAEMLNMARDTAQEYRKL